MAVDFEMAQPDALFHAQDGRLVDLVDGLLNHGVVVRGELCLAVAEVDLVFVGLDLILSTPQKMKETASCTR